MTYNFIRYDQDQQHLLPKSVADWVEDDSLEVFVSDVICKERLAAANNASGCFFGKQSLVKIAGELGIDTDSLTKHEVEHEIRVAVGGSSPAPTA